MSNFFVLRAAPNVNFLLYLCFEGREKDEIEKNVIRINEWNHPWVNMHTQNVVVLFCHVGI